MCKRVEKFRVCCQSRNKKAFEEFREGVIEIYLFIEHQNCGRFFLLFLILTLAECEWRIGYGAEAP